MGSFGAAKTGAVSMSKASSKSSSSESSNSNSFAQSLAAGTAQIGGQCGLSIYHFEYVCMYQLEIF